jgi:hypothetical protein
MLEGKSLGRVAEELGIGPATLTRWLGRRRTSEPLRPVKVQEGEEESSGQPFSLVVVTPSGWRIEGLRLADLAELLRALG